MTRDEAEILLHALFDDELDAGHVREVEAYIATCQRCAAQLNAYRDMRSAMAASDLAFYGASTATPAHRSSAPQNSYAKSSRRAERLRDVYQRCPP